MCVCACVCMGVCVWYVRHSSLRIGVVHRVCRSFLFYQEGVYKLTDLLPVGPEIIPKQWRSEIVCLVFTAVQR